MVFFLDADAFGRRFGPSSSPLEFDKLDRVFGNGCVFDVFAKFAAAANDLAFDFDVAKLFFNVCAASNVALAFASALESLDDKDDVDDDDDNSSVVFFLLPADVVLSLLADVATS